MDLGDDIEPDGGGEDGGEGEGAGGLSVDCDGRSCCHRGGVDDSRVKSRFKPLGKLDQTGLDANMRKQGQATARLARVGEDISAMMTL